MKVVAVLLAIACGVSALPAKLGSHHDPFGAFLAAKSSQNSVGYVYEPPAQPSGLYELPVNPTNIVEVTPEPTTTTTITPTTTPTTTPPPPPSGLYDVPDEVPQPNEPQPDIIKPDSTTMMPMPYNIAWDVRDEESGNVFNHVENSDGTDVTGEYSVLLPDGRMQIVRFRADPINGYQADVSYEPAK